LLHGRSMNQWMVVIFMVVIFLVPVMTGCVKWDI